MSRSQNGATAIIRGAPIPEERKSRASQARSQYHQNVHQPWPFFVTPRVCPFSASARSGHHDQQIVRSTSDQSVVGHAHAEETWPLSSSHPHHRRPLIAYHPRRVHTYIGQLKVRGAHQILTWSTADRHHCWHTRLAAAGAGSWHMLLMKSGAIRTAAVAVDVPTRSPMGSLRPSFCALANMTTLDRR